MMYCLIQLVSISYPDEWSNECINSIIDSFEKIKNVCIEKVYIGKSIGDSAKLQHKSYLKKSFNQIPPLKFQDDVFNFLHFREEKKERKTFDWCDFKQSQISMFSSQLKACSKHLIMFYLQFKLDKASEFTKEMYEKLIADLEKTGIIINSSFCHICGSRSETGYLLCYKETLSLNFLARKNMNLGTIISRSHDNGFYNQVYGGFRFSSFHLTNDNANMVRQYQKVFGENHVSIHNDNVICDVEYNNYIDYIIKKDRIDRKLVDYRKGKLKELSL